MITKTTSKHKIGKARPNLPVATVKFLHPTVQPSQLELQVVLVSGARQLVEILGSGLVRTVLSLLSALSASLCVVGGGLLYR